ncbi:MAG: hypothetical protein KGK07_15945 [Chloroflexota bacterium]|nr:hypothetical protein [Chloroflexota bacterium]
MAAKKKKTGFALLTPQRRAELGRRGGKAAASSGSAHRWNEDEARAAGKKSAQLRQEQEDE